MLVWCLPLICFPLSWLAAVGLPVDEHGMFLRLLGWAYLSLCVGYARAYLASRRGVRLLGPIHVGIVSNGGACSWLLYFGSSGAFSPWDFPLQVLAWGSAAATLLITVGLVRYGIYGEEPTAG